MLVYALFTLFAAPFFLCVLTQATPADIKYEKCVPLWTKAGCRINFHRGLTILIDDRHSKTHKIDWDNFSGYVHGLACRCRRKALALGNTWFALENYGICLTAPGSLQQYNKDYPFDKEHKCVGAVTLNASLVDFKTKELCVGGRFRAFFYQITNAREFDPTKGPTEEIITCSLASDVIFLIDVSGSIGETEFKLVQEFLRKLIDAFDFSNGNSRLGIISYDANCYVHLTWMDSTSMKVPEIRDVINEIKYDGGSTMTDNALKCARDKIIKPFQRQKVPKTLVVLSDGNSWNGVNRLGGITNELRGMGCTMLAIGVGGIRKVNVEELKTITGDLSHVFLLDSFEKLLANAARTINKLLAKACIS